MKRFTKYAEYLLFFIFTIMLLFLTKKLTILISLPMIVLIYYISTKLPKKYFPYILFSLTLLFRIITISVLDIKIVDDFKVMLEASRSLLTGNLSFLNNIYFQRFSYQLGHVLYQTLLLKIINHTTFLQIINSIINSLSIVFIYLIGKNIYKEKTARIVSFSYLFYLYPLYLNGILSNQHIPTLITLITIYLFIIKERTIKQAIIIATLLAISNVLRTESIIIIMALAFYQLFYKKDWQYSLSLIGTYLILGIAFSSLLSISPIHMKFKNNAPLWKFYCGLSYKYNGLYSEEEQDIFFTSSNQKELLLDRIKEKPYRYPILFLKKEVILWTQTNYDIQTNPSIPNILLNYNQGFVNIMMLIFVISLYPLKKRRKDSILIIKIIIALYFLIYMFIEVSPRYAFNLHMLLFLLLGIGIERIQKRLLNKE